MSSRILVLCLATAASAVLAAQTAPTLPAETLLDRGVLKALDEELSGVVAKDHVARLTQFHRVPASPGFHDAIEYVMERAKAIGLNDVHVETFPGDGTTFFGTCAATGLAVESGLLEEVSPQPRRITSVDDGGSRWPTTAERRRDVDLVAWGRDCAARRRRRCAASWCCAMRLLPLPPRSRSWRRRLISYNSNQVSAWWREIRPRSLGISTRGGRTRSRS